jgi:hypothetical protein
MASGLRAGSGGAEAARGVCCCGGTRGEARSSEVPSCSKSTAPRAGVSAPGAPHPGELSEKGCVGARW